MSAGFYLKNDNIKENKVTHLSWCDALPWQSLLLGWEFGGPSAAAKCREKNDQAELH